MNVDKLLIWSKNEFKDIPWRTNRSLYKTLVSEIMLQQTTVGTVRNHFEKFLKTFPDLKSLANATEEEVLIAWKGLGYYRRAKNLKKIAENLYFQFNNKFPETIDELQNIPGIGPYTANAIIAIGMNKRALAVDANLERVIARLFGIKIEKGVKLQKEIYKDFSDKKIFPNVKDYRALNEALMDLGRTFCQARKASCELCPLKESCFAFNHSKPLSFPIENLKVKKAKSVDHELHLVRLYSIKDKKILVYKKNDKEWLSGQYEVPTFITKSTDTKLTQYPKLSDEIDFDIHSTFTTGITKYKIKNLIVVINEKQAKKIGKNLNLEWRDFSQDSANLSTATIKGLRKLK